MNLQHISLTHIISQNLFNHKEKRMQNNLMELFKANFLKLRKSKNQ